MKTEQMNLNQCKMYLKTDLILVFQSHSKKKSFILNEFITNMLNKVLQKYSHGLNTFPNLM